VSVRAYQASSSTSALEDGKILRRELLDHDVSIKVHFCGICHTDVHMLHDDWHKSHYPLVPGHEIAGVVDAVGAKVTHFKVGQTVGVGCIVDSCGRCDHCTTGLQQHCASGMTMTYGDEDHISGGYTFGGYSERIVVQEKYVLDIPAGLDLAEAAPLLCAGVTMWTPLKEHGAAPGKTVGIVGVGGLGHMGLKLAHALGAKVIAFTSKPEKTDELIALGAHQVIITSDEHSLNTVKDSIDLIIDTISAEHDLLKYFNTLKFKGTYVVVGGSPQPLPVNVFPLLFKRILFTGSAIGGIEATQEMLNFCAKHKIGATIEIAPLQKVNEVLARLEKGDVRYRFVLDVKNYYH